MLMNKIKMNTHPINCHYQSEHLVILTINLFPCVFHEILSSDPCNDIHVNLELEDYVDLVSRSTAESRATVELVAGSRINELH